LLLSSEEIQAVISEALSDLHEGTLSRDVLHEVEEEDEEVEEEEEDGGEAGLKGREEEQPLSHDAEVPTSQPSARASQQADERREHFRRKSHSLDTDTADLEVHEKATGVAGCTVDEGDNQDGEEDEGDGEDDDEPKSFALLEAMASVYRQLLGLVHGEVRASFGSNALMTVSHFPSASI
jgi:hypothetical protein